jgi:hypothetical protein
VQKIPLMDWRRPVRGAQHQLVSPLVRSQGLSQLGGKAYHMAQAVAASVAVSLYVSAAMPSRSRMHWVLGARFMSRSESLLIRTGANLHPDAQTECSPFQTEHSTQEASSARLLPKERGHWPGDVRLRYEALPVASQWTLPRSPRGAAKD